MTSPRFQFERAAVGDDLTLMPLELRYRLDVAGIKLSLAAWQALSPSTRLALCALSVASPDAVATFAARVDEAVASVGHAAPRIDAAPTPHPWLGDAALADVVRRARGLGLATREARWSELDDEQRYALSKTASKGKSDERFTEALKEFGLA